MNLVKLEGVVGTVKLSDKEVRAANNLFEFMISGRSPVDFYDEFSREFRVLFSGAVYPRNEGVMGFLYGKYGSLPFAEEGIQMHVGSINCTDTYPLFMFGRTGDKTIFKGAIIYGSHNPRPQDDIARRLGEFAVPKIFGMDSSTFPHPLHDWENDITLYGFGAIHDAGRIQRLHWLVHDMFEDLTKYCSLNAKEISVLFRDARVHENVAVRDLSRERYERIIDEICAPLRERMERDDLEIPELLESGEKKKKKLDLVKSK